jgi:hypothetical protein
MLDRLLARKTFVLFLAFGCLAAYVPAFNNGFIADDYVNLEWAGKFFAHPGFLFTVPPQNFRMTSFVVFEVLKRIFGYQPAVWYAVNTGLHFIACLLLCRVLRRIEGEWTAALATFFFAVFQAPQEAVMWVSAMNETLAGVFIVGALLLWMKNKHGWALLCYSLALISKESAPILLLLIPVLQWRQKKPLFTREYFFYFIPTAVFAAVFLKTWSANSMIHYQIYAISPRALLVLAITIHRLLWPWMYVFLALAMVWGVMRLSVRAAATALVLIAIPMLPYIFLTYDKHLPSRQLYLASIVFVAILARLTEKIARTELRTAVVVVFCLWNVFYMWMTKDRQFLERAAPTTELLRVLQTHAPTHIRIDGFAYPEPDIAKDVSALVPGWTRDLIEVSGACADCLVLKWDPAARTYKERASRGTLNRPPPSAPSAQTPSLLRRGMGFVALFHTPHSPPKLGGDALA